MLFDTNVLLDVLLKRQPFVRDAALLVSHVEKGHLTGLICATTVTTLFYEALKLPFADYEDAVLHEAARHAGADAVVTRNTKDFSGAALHIYAPQELIHVLP